MRTVTDTLQEMTDGIRETLKNLLLNHSSVYRRNDHSGQVVLLSAHGDYAYRELKDPGRQVQAKLFEKYRLFHSLLKTLLREQPRDTLKKLAEADTLILRTIEQQHTCCQTTQEAFDRASEALLTQINLLKHLYDPSTDATAYIPDTNALLYNPVLENWAFDGIQAFTLILLSTILSELDALKINHRNEAVRQKAETLIRQIKEYRRRGNLTEGVPLLKGTSTILAVATEPDMENSLPWLDATNNDDRFLAAVIEVMRLRPRSAVILVSRDINVQNKAAFTSIPFAEPPEPK